MSKKYVLFYQSGDDVKSKTPPLFPAHFIRIKEFHGRGELLMVGTFGNPQEEGAMSIFTTREAAEAFAKGDPFVVNGAVRSWRVLEWIEALTQGLFYPGRLRKNWKRFIPMPVRFLNEVRNVLFLWLHYEQQIPHPQTTRFGMTDVSHGRDYANFKLGSAFSVVSAR
jgi:uncharacterized protein